MGEWVAQPIPPPSLSYTLPSVNSVRYVEWLLVQGLDPRTVAIYLRRLIRASQLCDGWGWDLRALTAAQLALLVDQFPRSHSSLSILRSALIHYWAMHGVVGPVKAIRPPKPPPYQYRGLEPEEASKLESVARGRWPDGAAVMLGLYLALRREEIASLTWESFDPQFGWVTVMGKGSRTRHLPVHANLHRELAYRRGEGFLFPPLRRGGLPHVHTATVRTWVGNVAEDAGLGRVAPHQLRHTCLATMNDETGDLRVTQYFAGHSDPATTAVYTRATQRRLLMAVSSLNYGGTG